MVSAFKASPAKPKSVLPQDLGNRKQVFYSAVSHGNHIPTKQKNAMQNFPVNKRLSSFDG
jgi:hypothetical protein